MSSNLIMLYTLVAFFYIISPGPAVFLAIANGITKDMRAVVSSSLGNIVGLFVLSTISILGLGALLVSSATLFLAVKIIGAIYLVYLGLKQISISRNPKLLDQTSDTKLKTKTHWQLFTESFFVAATNPKPILFFVALFPQFLVVNAPIAPQFVILTAIFMAISFLSLCTYGYISNRANFLFAKKQTLVWFHRCTGGLFILMGVSLLKLKNV